MNTPLALTDAQLLIVMERAKLLRRFLRGAFLQAVACELQGKEIGDGSVMRACLKAARQVETQNWAKHGPPPAISGMNDMPMASAK